jgi:hypothetical protein
MRQVQIKKGRKIKTSPLDLRTPSGTVLPY